jgi:hypothetical protein
MDPDPGCPKTCVPVDPDADSDPQHCEVQGQSYRKCQLLFMFNSFTGRHSGGGYPRLEGHVGFAQALLLRCTEKIQCASLPDFRPVIQTNL